MEPEKPDPAKTAEIVQKIMSGVLALSGALRDASKASKQADRLPFERELQIQKFLAYTGIYTQDLREWHSRGRLDLLAQALRSLMELSVWIEFCNRSNENAREFVMEAYRDNRDLLKATLKLYEGKNSEMEARLKQEITQMDADAAKYGITDFERSYMRVNNAAKELGNRESLTCPPF
jgi:hypothetical protein